MAEDPLYGESLDESSPIGGDVTETLEKRREALQAYGFRESAFRWGGILCLVVGLIWVILMANAPDDSAPEAAFYLWGAKTSLCTIVLVTVVVSLLRFAIKCYGHHQRSTQDSEMVNPAKIGEVVLKLAPKVFE